MTAVLEGIGVAVPSRIVTNDELALTLETSDEWIRTRTGIAQRYVAEPGTGTGDLAVEAGAHALKSAGTSDVDLVIVVTMTPDRTCPDTAPGVAARLGLGTVGSFDLNAACAGFIYGLATAGGMLATGVANRILLVGAETMARVVDPTDRGTAVLFGDGAGAVVLRAGTADEPGAIGPYDLGSDGDSADLLATSAGGSLRPIDERALAERANFLKMDGKEVYRQAVARMVDSSRRVLDRAGMSIDDVDRMVGHQANARILEAVAKRLGVPEARRVSNVAKYGNTSAASIPLALADADLRPGETVLLTAFGAGMSWASTLLTWPQLTAA